MKQSSQTCYSSKELNKTIPKIILPCVSPLSHSSSCLSAIDDDMGLKSEQGSSDETASDQPYATCLFCRRSTFRLLLYIIGYVGYLCFGAICFQVIETPLEVAQRNELLLQRKEFLTRNEGCVDEEELDEFIGMVTRAAARGVSLTDVHGGINHSNWDFSQSIFFSATVLTTIGYGRTTPLSEWGKGFCIAFSLFGIPLTLILFSAMVERIHQPFRRLRTYLAQRLYMRMDVFYIRMIHLGIATSIVTVGFFILPAFLLYQMEPTWTYLDAIYYSVITLTTIGLGDFIPGEEASGTPRVIYKLIITIYLFVGLIAVLFLLEVYHDMPELNMGYYVYMKSDNLEPVERPLLNSKKMSYASLDTEILHSEFNCRTLEGSNHVKRVSK